MHGHIRMVVKKLINKYGTSSPDELASYLGITIMVEPLGKVWGMYKYIRKNKIIFINSTLSEDIHNYVLAHELGHAILHPKTSCFCYGLNINSYKKEHEANLFSSELLINNIVSFEIENYSLQQLSSYYNVPIGLLKLKFDIV